MKNPGKQRKRAYSMLLILLRERIIERAYATHHEDRAKMAG